LTQAPSRKLNLLKLSQAELSKELVNATERKWIAGAGTNCTGSDKKEGP